MRFFWDLEAPTETSFLQLMSIECCQAKAQTFVALPHNVYHYEGFCKVTSPLNRLGWCQRRPFFADNP